MEDKSRFEPMLTPKRPFNHLLASSVVIPASPSMPCIGMGTGISVYSMKRSPASGHYRSPWAIKKVNRILSRSNVEKRLVMEANVLRTLNHPNIVGFRAFVESKDGRKCLAMEACEISLGDVIEERNSESLGPFPVNNIFTVATDISEALCYLHEKCNLLHGDIKSYNILIKGDFEVAKLCDFGVTVRLDSKGVALPGQEYIGTHCWCAPEVIVDYENDDDKGDPDQKITSKADIFSFGLTLWEMLALRPPHIPDNDLSESGLLNDSSCESSLDTVGTCPDIPEDVGEEYKDVVCILQWCCDEDYCERPSAKEIIQLINNLKNDS